MICTALGIVVAIAYAVLQIFVLMRAKVRVYCIAATAKPGEFIA